MAYGNNMTGTQPRAHFQLAGGTIIKFRHPYLAGQISGNSNLDEIDVSACVKLDGRYFEATPNQESARQEVLIDGSTVTICNRLLNGTITMPVIRTTGIVATGDFVSALQLIKSVGDTVGGLLYKTDFRNGKAITRVYYGVTVASVPDDVSEGMSVPVYDVRLLYAGWIEVVGTNVTENKKKIWSVGASQGLEAYFAPYALQNADGNTGTKDGAMVTGDYAPNWKITQENKDNDPGASTSTPNLADSSTEGASDYTDSSTGIISDAGEITDLNPSDNG